jgi:hypothetical protein
VWTRRELLRAVGAGATLAALTPLGCAATARPVTDAAALDRDRLREALRAAVDALGERLGAPFAFAGIRRRVRALVDLDQRGLFVEERMIAIVGGVEHELLELVGGVDGARDRRIGHRDAGGRRRRRRRPGRPDRRHRSVERLGDELRERRRRSGVDVDRRAAAAGRHVAVDDGAHVAERLLATAAIVADAPPPSDAAGGDPGAPVVERERAPVERAQQRRERGRGHRPPRASASGPPASSPRVTSHGTSASRAGPSSASATAARSLLTPITPASSSPTSPRSSRSPHTRPVRWPRASSRARETRTTT